MLFRAESAHGAQFRTILLTLVCLSSLNVLGALTFNTGPKRARPETMPGVDERQVLLDAAAELSEDPSSQLASWSADNPDDHCVWEGVRCNDEGRVSDLYLHGGGLAGRIPSVLSALQDLETMNLANNRLTGTIPAELGACRQLTLLELENNRLTGTIPPALANARLVDIYLSNNQLSGTIPPEFALLRDLFNLYLNGNKLTGSIPAEFSRLAWSIEEFAVQDNYLSGDLEEQLHDLGMWWSGDYMETLEYYPQHSA